jgi:hypothetical protein
MQEHAEARLIQGGKSFGDQSSDEESKGALAMGQLPEKSDRGGAEIWDRAPSSCSGEVLFCHREIASLRYPSIPAKTAGQASQKSFEMFQNCSETPAREVGKTQRAAQV